MSELKKTIERLLETEDGEFDAIALINDICCLTVNEKRELLGYPQLENGNVILVSDGTELVRVEVDVTSLN